jgi:predicted HAD superfamily Cof-like phosphohydrolase
MTDEQRMVAEFHRAFGILVGGTPAVPDEATQRLRLRLIQEEFDEVKEAFQVADEAAIAKELADLLYVVYGTAVSCGIDMQPVFREVHRSNMSKVGGHKREDGKWIKPATYSPAAVAPVLAAQRSSGLLEDRPLAEVSGRPADPSGGIA